MIDNNKSVGKWNWLIAFLAVLGVVGIFCGFIYFWIGHFSRVKDGMSFAGQYGDSFGVLNSLFSGLGFSVLIVTLLYQQKQIKLQSIKDNYEVEERRSLFNLHSCEEANVKAMGLLRDNNNDRSTWIRAARLLGHASVLAKGVTIENHLRVLEFKSLEYRTFFRELLEDKPAAFFYGVNYDGVDVAAAASASSMPGCENGINLTSGNSVLCESSIFSIVAAAQWPDNYIDPLKEKFSDDGIDKATFFYGGLREFLYHTRQWASTGGVLRRRGGVDIS